MLCLFKIVFLKEIYNFIFGMVAASICAFKTKSVLFCADTNKRHSSARNVLKFESQVHIHIMRLMDEELHLRMNVGKRTLKCSTMIEGTTEI